jgi:hypothetical protein
VSYSTAENRSTYLERIVFFIRTVQGRRSSHTKLPVPTTFCGVRRLLEKPEEARYAPNVANQNSKSL